MVDVRKMKARAETAKIAFSEASVGQKIAVIMLVGMAALIITIFFSLFGGSSGADTENEAVKSSLRGLTVLNTQKPGTVIEDTDSIQGKAAVKAEEDRVLAEAKKGKSSFQAMTNNAKNENPYDRLNQPPKKPAQFNGNKPRMMTPADFVNAGIKKNNKDVSKEPGEILPGTANKFDTNELAKDRYVGMTEQRFLTEIAESRNQNSEKLKGLIQDALDKQKTSVAADLTSLVSDENPADEGYSQNGSVNSASSTGSNTKALPPVLLQPGDTIIATARIPVDSRTTSKFVLYGVSPEAFRDARITCTYSFNGKHIIPICSEIFIKGKQGKMEAVAINPRTLSGIVEQDVDDSGILKNMAFIGTQMLSQIAPMKLAQGKKVTQTDNSTVEENTITDRDIVITGFASGLGALSGKASEYYSSPAVATIAPGTSIMLVQTAPMPDWWGITEKKYEW